MGAQQRRQRWLHRPAVVAAVALALMFGAGSGARAGTTETALAITHYRQNESNWCWASAAQVVIKWHTGTKYAQCTLAKYGKGSSTCANSVGSTGDIEKIVDHYLGEGGNWHNAGIYNLYLSASIDQRRPIISRIQWRAGGGHFVTVYGYRNTNGAYTVLYSNENGAVGTGTDAKRSTRTVAQFVSNSDFTNTHNMSVGK